MIEEPNIIKSRSVSMREQEAAKLKHQQQRKMESGGEIDMASALAKVRTSDTTIPINLSRYNGSYLYTDMTPPKGERD
jgi:hypothetical protein